MILLPVIAFSAASAGSLTARFVHASISLFLVGVTIWWFRKATLSVDPLTGLPTRARFERRVVKARARANRQGTGLAILFVDFDDLKTVNDTHGHARGDEILAAAADRLAGSLPAGCAAARLWGDDFVVLVEGVVSRADAAAVAERVLAAVSRPIRVDDVDTTVRASIGVALNGSAGTSSGELLRMAEVAMFAAKRNGKARYEVYEEIVHGSELATMRMRSELKRAIDGGELVLYFQPIFELAPERVVGLEALVRWRHPSRGLLGPLEFIPLAEETGLILPLGRWVLNEACRQVGLWQQMRANDAPLFISVNLSPKQLLDPELSLHVVEALRGSGLDGSSLILEITESMIMHDVKASGRVLQELKRLGVRVALDDFGAGYSSLMYLQDLPVDILKVDKSFVDEIGASREPGLTGAIVKLAHTLGLQTIAEGIEEPEQLHHLRELDCEMGQGFLFARPAEPDGIAQLLGSSLLLTI
jgi:diguanylate cyclase (GGDEF)-like protein